MSRIQAEPWRADWWIEAERRRGGRTFRIGESFESLKAAALAGESGVGDGAGEDEGLPCFCTHWRVYNKARGRRESDGKRWRGVVQFQAPIQPSTTRAGPKTTPWFVNSS